ncbi:MAG: substrate-binding domain-containing protein [Lentisphaerota bacterium]
MNIHSNNGYKEIADTLEKRIVAGTYGLRLPTTGKLCTEYSVSNVTMQRAIKVLKERNIVNAAPRRGIHPTRLKRPRTHVIGVVLPGSHAPLHDQLIHGIGNRANSRSELIVMSPGTDGDSRKEIIQIRELVEKKGVDGVILWPSLEYGTQSPAVVYLKEERIPFVLVPESSLETYSDCHTVSNTDSEGGAKVMEHLFALGHKKIAFVTNRSFEKSIFNKHRQDHYMNLMIAKGLKPLDPLYIDDIKGKEGFFSKVSAVFCVNDGIAIEVLKHCLSVGIRIPRQLGIAGYDNIQTAKDMCLTSIEQHFGKMGKLAVDTLLGEIEGEFESPRHLNVKSELVVRASTEGEVEFRK